MDCSHSPNTPKRIPLVCGSYPRSSPPLPRPIKQFAEFPTRPLPLLQRRNGDNKLTKAWRLPPPSLKSNLWINPKEGARSIGRSSMLSMNKVRGIGTKFSGTDLFPQNSAPLQSENWQYERVIFRFKWTVSFVTTLVGYSGSIWPWTLDCCERLALWTIFLGNVGVHINETWLLHGMKEGRRPYTIAEGWSYLSRFRSRACVKD